MKYLTYLILGAVVTLAVLFAPWLMFWATGVLWGWRPELTLQSWCAFYVVWLSLLGLRGSK